MANPPQHDPTLEDAWASAVITQLALPAPHVGLLQPALSVPPGDDALWSLMGALPANLSGTLIAPTTVPFFGEYAAVAMAALAEPSTFRQDIGEDVFNEWMAYLASQTPLPPVDALPTLFQRWAMVKAPAVAEVGTSDLAREALENDAIQALEPYLGGSARTPDYMPDADTLTKTLAAASAAKVALKGFTGKAGFGRVAGLWSGSPPTSRLACRFAAGSVTATASFRLAVSAVTPGVWYNSGLLNSMRAGQGSPPWPKDGSACWAEFFGPQGSLRQAMTGMAFVADIALSVTSTAAFTASDQDKIRAAAPLGLWPFYLPEGDTAAYDVRFSASGALTYTLTTSPGTAVALGATVLPPG